MDLRNKRVLITGAGSGIGRQLAFSCAQRGAALWLTDIDAAGLVAPPRMAVYAATKFAVIGLSESLRNELLDHDIRVSAVCPGVVDTPITRNSRLTGSLSERAGFQDEVAEIYRRRNYGPERVAEVVLRAVERGHSGILPVTPESWLLYLGNRLAPGLIADLQRRSAVI